ncbi:MAG: TatD DNase family protein [Parasphingorhabdus sp.]|jgi:TatD DNase family protein
MTENKSVIIDSHCHLDFMQFDTDREQVLQRCRENGISDIVVPGVCRSNWSKQIKLCEANDELHFGLGLHPLFLARHELSDIDELARQSKLTPPVAIGEIGLDFFDKSLSREKQKMFFERQLELAQALGLPVILHVRKAHDDTLKILQSFSLCGGIVHAFNGTLDQAYRYMDLGFKLGFGGMLTFARSRKLQTLVKSLPIDSLVLETDAPDMTVASHRGERNSPEYLPECLEAMASLREESVFYIAEKTSANSREILCI